MKIFQTSKKRAMLAILLLTLAGVTVSTFYITQDRALGDTKTAPPMKEMGGMPGIEGMKMGVNETGQAAAMLTSEKKQRIGVKIAEVREKEIEKVIRTVGRVAYDERKLARINLRVDGWIQDLFVNFTGQEVRKGEPLLTLYSPDLLSTQQEYLLAKRGEAKLKASPIAEVRETGGALLSSARTRLLLSGITKKQIQELGERGEPQTAITITSPISGVVTKREGIKGMRVTPEMTLYEIADLS
ncbi:MAG TPA: efflux RND transporter periplasmic adaptor subunit, partial [Candidatus Manganitrophaceae bacterium]|nr:efflux RND transporter periplasmic adaptor subunit [Candidatus Manganitrophaceae bacterium]